MNATCLIVYPKSLLPLVPVEAPKKCHIAGGINHSGERLQAGRSSGQLAKSHCLCAAVESPFFESAGADVTIINRIQGNPLSLAVIVPSATRMLTNCPDVVVLPEAWGVHMLRIFFESTSRKRVVYPLAISIVI
jgi:hypothetical protein